MKGEIMHMEKMMDPDRFVTYWQISVRVEEEPKLHMGFCDIQNKEQPVKQHDKDFYT